MTKNKKYKGVFRDKKVAFIVRLNSRLRLMANDNVLNVIVTNGGTHLKTKNKLMMSYVERGLNFMIDSTIQTII